MSQSTSKLFIQADEKNILQNFVIQRRPKRRINLNDENARSTLTWVTGSAMMDIVSLCIFEAAMDAQ